MSGACCFADIVGVAVIVCCLLELTNTGTVLVVDMVASYDKLMLSRLVLRCLLLLLWCVCW